MRGPVQFVSRLHVLVCASAWHKSTPPPCGLSMTLRVTPGEDNELEPDDPVQAVKAASDSTSTVSLV